MKKEFYLITDSSLTSCYMVSRWLEEFSDKDEFKGVLLSEEQPTDSVLKQRNDFHAKYAGQKVLTDEIYYEIARLYNGFDETEKAMINLFGVPDYSTTFDPGTVFLGHNINGEYARNWLSQNLSFGSCSFIFTYVFQILKPWWLENTGTHLINIHSAVLPYARGLYSIENIAALEDIEQFKRAAGITIHFIDQGVDTGPIIRAERIISPFRFNSIWELKGYTYMIGCRLYVETAKHFIFDSETNSVGIVGDPSLRGPNFRNKDFTDDQKRRSEEGYLSMKLKVLNELQKSPHIKP